MVGRYDGEYKDGVAPHAWTGSVAIMERYLTDGGRPVEYGQCWVYSGLVVTICRALGTIFFAIVIYLMYQRNSRRLLIDYGFQVFLVVLLPTMCQPMIRTGPSQWTNTSIVMATKYQMDRMKIVTIPAGTSMYGTMYGCNDLICLKVSQE